MLKTSHPRFSRRERQIMDVVYRRGRATVAEVLAELPDPPSYSSVRTLLTLLERKGHLRHEQDGPRYVFVPTLGQRQARRAALRQVIATFFSGSPEHAAAALLDEADLANLPEETLDRLAKRIEKARRNKEES